MCCNNLFYYWLYYLGFEAAPNSVSLLEPQTLRGQSRESLGKSSYKNIHESVLDLVLVQHYIYKTLINTNRVYQLLKPVYF